MAAPRGHDRQSDADLHKRQLDARHGERPADRHHQNESARHEPECAAAQVRGEDAHGHHDEHVVEAADRVHEAVREAACVPDACVGEGRRH